MTGYQIQWSSRATGGWDDLEDDTGNTRTTYQDTGLAPNTTRYYRVRAISGAGQSAWSNVDHATTDDLTPPGAPTRLRAVMPSVRRGSDELVLTWVAPVDDGGSAVTGYLIEWSAVPALARGSRSCRTPNHRTGHTPTVVLAPTPPGIIACPRSTARGRAVPPNVAHGTTRAAPPGPPRNLDVDPRGTGPDSIVLTWDAPAPETDGGAPITGYTVQRIGPNNSTQRFNTGTTATTFKDTGLQPATAYRYQVAAINRVGTGRWSLERRTSTYAAKPGAPTGLTARAVGTSRIDLSWSAPRSTGGAPSSATGSRPPTTEAGPGTSLSAATPTRGGRRSPT